MINNRVYLIELFDIYHKLLTKKQQAHFKLHFFDDLSLNEIADQYQVSKVAIYDSIEKSKNALLLFENNLKIYEKQQKRLNFYQSIDDKQLQEQLIKLENE